MILKLSSIDSPDVGEFEKYPQHMPEVSLLYACSTFWELRSKWITSKTSKRRISKKSNFKNQVQVRSKNQSSRIRKKSEHFFKTHKKSKSNQNQHAKDEVLRSTNHLVDRTGSCYYDDRWKVHTKDVATTKHPNTF